MTDTMHYTVHCTYRTHIMLVIRLQASRFEARATRLRCKLLASIHGVRNEYVIP